MNIAQLRLIRQIPIGGDGAVFKLTAKSENADYEMQSTFERARNSEIPFFTKEKDIPSTISIEKKGKYIYLSHILVDYAEQDLQNNKSTANGFVLNGEDYFELAKNPQDVIGFSAVSGEQTSADIEQSPVLEQLPCNGNFDMTNIVSTYLSNKNSSEILLRCVYTMFFSNSSEALNIILPENCTDTIKATRDMMFFIYSRLPFSIRLNLSFSSSCGKMALGKHICFTTKPEEHCSFVNLSNGEYKLNTVDTLLCDPVIDQCVEGSDLDALFEKLDAFCGAYSDRYNVSYKNLRTAYLYYQTKHEGTFQGSEETCVNTISEMLDIKSSDQKVIDDFITELLLYILDNNIHLDSAIEEKLSAKIESTDFTILKHLKPLNDARILGDNCSNESFEKLYTLKQEQPSLYETTLKYLTGHADNGFLDKYYAQCYLAKNHSSYNDISDIVKLAKELTFFPETQAVAMEYFLEHFATYTSCDYFDYKLFEQAATECFGNFQEALEKLLSRACEFYWKRFDCASFDLSRIDEYRSMFRNIPLCKEYKAIIEFAVSLNDGKFDVNLFADTSAILEGFFQSIISPAQCDIMIYKIRGILLKKRMPFNLDVWLLLYYSNKEKAVNFDKMFTNMYHTGLMEQIFCQDAQRIIQKSTILKDRNVLDGFLSYVSDYVKKSRPMSNVLTGFAGMIDDDSKGSSLFDENWSVYAIVILCTVISTAIVVWLIAKYF